MSRHKFGIQVYTGEYIFIVLNQLILRLFYYTSIKEDINKSIKIYDFGELTQILKDLNAISRFKDIFIKLQEIYKDNMLNIKVRDFIENEPLEILIKFIYNNANSKFSI